MTSLKKSFSDSKEKSVIKHRTSSKPAPPRMITHFNPPPPPQKKKKKKKVFGLRNKFRQSWTKVLGQLYSLNAF